VATSLNNLASLYQDMGQYAEALPLYRRSLAIREKVHGPEHPAVAGSLNNLARLYQDMGQYADAMPLYTRAEQTAAAAGARETLWRTQLGLSVAHDRAGQPALAIFWGKQSVNTIQSLRAGLASLDRELQQSFLLDKRHAYAVLADLLIRAGRFAEAEQVLALLKQQELHELTRRSDAAPSRADMVGAERALAEEGEALITENVARARELEQLNRRARGGELTAAEQARREQLQQQAQQWRARHQQWVAALAQRLTATEAGRAGQLQQQAEQSAGRMARLVRRDAQGAVGLHYVVTEERLSIMVVTAEATFARTVPLKRAVLNQQIGALRAVLQDRNRDPRPAAQALYATLIGPIEADLRAAAPRTLVVSLTEGLRYLPFAALHDGSDYLIRRYALSQFVAGAEQRAEASREAWQVAGLGTTQAVAGLGALPGVRQELQAIVRTDGSPRGLLPGSIALDEQFNRPRLQQALDRRYPVLHIGSHFVFRPGSEANSFLLLGDGDKLTLGQLGVLPFEDVDLVALSACDTAMGGGINEYGAEVEGLATSLVKRGAQAVLATLWPVADPSTAQLMQQFYRQRATTQPLGRAQALRQAQLALLEGTAAPAAAPPAAFAETGRGASRPGAGSDAAPFTPDPAKPYAHPYFWAPFILMGNWL
jgi:CHAT domain-containing protein